MFGGKRKKYNGDVSALLPSFGFTIEEAGIWKSLEALDVAWSQKYSKYEGALFLAYLFLSGILKEKDIERSKSIIDRINTIQPAWVSMGLVRTEIANRLTKKAEGWIETTAFEIRKKEWNPISLDKPVFFYKTKEKETTQFNQENEATTKDSPEETQSMCFGCGTIVSIRKGLGEKICHKCGRLVATK